MAKKKEPAGPADRQIDEEKQPLLAHLLALLGGFPFLLLLLGFNDQPGNLNGLTLPVNTDHVDICPVDHLPFAVQSFPIGVDTDLHGGAANIGHYALQHDHVTGVSRSFELQIVDGSSGDDATAVANGNDARQFIDPFQ